MSNYVHIAKVRDWMNDQGIPRGFEHETLRKKIRHGSFVVPYIRIGNTPYFLEQGLIDWLKENTK
tara:strand:+ start:226 stop:420 length:195 start_codon:yes stop_codon:yes gene_type:complete